MAKHYWLRCFLFVNIATISTLVFGASEKIEVPLFLFSGQSNMVGLGASVSDLTGDQTDSVENIKIYQESEGVHTGRWLTLGPGFGSDDTQFGPELFFGKTLSDSMPGRKIAFIKDAVSGTYLGKSEGWLPPSSGGPGTLYRNMMNHIDDALESFNDAFDTSEYTPRWAGFIWHQGEFDAWEELSLANSYEENLTNLINDIREMTDVENLPVIIPMIADNFIWQYNAIVREAEIAVAEEFDNCDTMDTKGFGLSDGVHYNAESMVIIGEVCAIRWLAMEFLDDVVPVVYKWKQSTTSDVPCSPSNFTFFDVSGRKVCSHSASSAASQLPLHTSPLMLIRITTSQAGKRHISKALNLQR